MSCPTAQCLKRLQIELRKLAAEPDPAFIVNADPQNMLRCYFVMNGPEGTPYAGGRYIGLLEIPPDYPFKPPSVQLCTPSGRFRTGMAICLSNSSYHPEQWSPMWGLRTILIALVSFFVSNEATTGSMESSESERRKFASGSRQYNVERIKAVYKRVLPAAYAEDVAFIEKQHKNGPPAAGTQKADADSDSGDEGEGDVAGQPGGKRGRNAQKSSPSVDAKKSGGGGASASSGKAGGAKDAGESGAAEDAAPPRCAGDDDDGGREHDDARAEGKAERNEDGLQRRPYPFQLGSDQKTDLLSRLGCVSWRRWVSMAVLVVVAMALADKVR